MVLRVMVVVVVMVARVVKENCWVRLEKGGGNGGKKIIGGTETRLGVILYGAELAAQARQAAKPFSR